MFWVFDVFFTEGSEWSSVVYFFPWLPRVMGWGVVFPSDEVVIAIIFRIDSGIEDAIDDVLFLAIYLDAWWWVLRLIRVTRFYRFEEGYVEYWVDLH